MSVATGNCEHDMVTRVLNPADMAFSRAAGVPVIEGNHVRLLKDARENYPAWLDAIGRSKHHIHFENYIIREDDTGYRFADALIAKAQEGVLGAAHPRLDGRPRQDLTAFLESVAGGWSRSAMLQSPAPWQSTRLALP